MALTDSQKRNIDVIIGVVRDYMDARAETAIRINVRLGGIYEDIAFQQITQMRLVLAGFKGFGPVKLMVGDIFLSDDEPKIRDLFNPTNQVSLLTEIVQEKEEKSKKTAGNLEIHDMPSMYSALDPSLEKIVLLIQCWIWWDLEDAIDVVRFNQTCQRVAMIDKSGVPEAMAQWYAEQFRLAAQQVSPEVIICHELAKAVDYLQDFQIRRGAEEGYKVIIRREQTQENSPDTLIKSVARQYSVVDAVREQKAVDPNLRASYAKVLGVAPEAVTPDRVVSAAEHLINEGKSRLKAALSGQQGGRPYDYKAWQLERMQALYEQVRRGREPQKMAMPRPADAAHRR